MKSCRLTGLEEVKKVKKYEELQSKRAGKRLKIMNSCRERGLEEVNMVMKCEKL